MTTASPRDSRRQIKQQCKLTGRERLQVIGAGGFGTIYYDSSRDVVVKAIIRSNSCNQAFNEMNTQFKIHVAFEDLADISGVSLDGAELSVDDLALIQNVKQYVKVSKALSSCDKPIVINDITYSCYFFMERLSGVPVAKLLAIDPLLFKNTRDSYRPSDVMVHMAFNSDLPAKLYPVVQSKKPISDINPSRGYFLDDAFDVTVLNMPLRKSRVKEMIGFVYSYIYFHEYIIPLDIEFTIGWTQDGEFVMNVLDFGMTIDMKNGTYAEYSDVIGMDISLDEKAKLLEDRVREKLSYDLYCDVEDDSACMTGWESGKKAAMVIRQ